MDHTFEQIFLNYYDSIKTFAYSYVKNKPDADDVTQNVFIQVYKKLHTVRDVEHIKQWIFKICRNLSINLIKSRRETTNELLEGDSIVTFDIDKQFLIGKLYDLINGLPIGYRSVIKLKLEGYKHSEIGYMLDSSESTSKITVKEFR